jgi:succinyl-diaminopimelate desuccinylase
LLVWAERFVATSSVSDEGNRAIADQAARLLREAGIEPRLETVEMQGDEHRAVLADLGPPGDPREASGLLLVTHLDTVPPGDPAAWTATGGDPLRPTREGDLLYGLGSADAKTDFVCKVAALAEIERGGLRRPVRIVGTFGEEIGLLGTRWLVDSGLAQGFRYALVGEPSELVAIHAHKGYAVFEARVPLEATSQPGGGRLDQLRFEGRSAHSSTPKLGTNAIELALERLAMPDVQGLVEFTGGCAVNKVPEQSSLTVFLEGGTPAPSAEVYAPKPLVAFHKAWRRLMERLTLHRDSEFDPDHTVGSLGRASLGGGQAVFRFDLRTLPGIDPELAVRPLGEVAELECLRKNPSLGTAQDSPLLDAIALAQESLGLERRIGTKSTCTEAGLLAEAGLEAVVLGAGSSVGNIHRPNEHMRISELTLAREIYRETIRKLCME